MPGPFAVGDTIIGPIITQLTSYLNAQIPGGFSEIYQVQPDSKPLNNSAVILCSSFTNKEETNGIIDLTLHLAIVHYFRRGRYKDNLEAAYAMLPAYLSCLTAWPNQDINNLAREISVKDGLIRQDKYAGEPVVMLAIAFDVETQYFISAT
jgi:hypothetical protein